MNTKQPNDKPKVLNKTAKRLKRMFWNDGDGFSARDFLMTLSVGLFAFAWSFGIATEALISLGIVEEAALTENFFGLLDQMKSIVTPIVIGLFGVQGIQIGAEAYKSKHSFYDESSDDPQNYYEGGSRNE